jgi:RNA polymerase sigma-70 factor (ECF subfamily)
MRSNRPALLASGASPLSVVKRRQVPDASVIETRDKTEDADDDALLVSSGGGDQRAFQALVARHLARVLSLARRITGNVAEAEDVAQEAFLRAWQKAPDWRVGEARFSTWLYRVAVNLCLDRKRRKPMAPLEAAGDPLDPAPSAESRLAEHQRTRIVAAALAGLPDRQRAALVLSYYEGVSNVEAARVLGVSVSALESLLVRARKALRAELERHRAAMTD